MKRDQENMLDLSPTTTDSLILASDFKCDEYVEKDRNLGLDIRNVEIQIEIATARFAYLFGSV